MRRWAPLPNRMTERPSGDGGRLERLRKRHRVLGHRWEPGVPATAQSGEPGGSGSISPIRRVSLCASCVRQSDGPMDVPHPTHHLQQRPNPHEPHCHRRPSLRPRRRVCGDPGRLPDRAHRVRDPVELRPLSRSDDGRERVVARDLCARDGDPEPVVGDRGSHRGRDHGSVRSRAGDRPWRRHLRHGRRGHGGVGQRARAPSERRPPRWSRRRVHLVLALACRHRAGSFPRNAAPSRSASAPRPARSAKCSSHRSPRP